jgi:hypothetical protein
MNNKVLDKIIQKQQWVLNTLDYKVAGLEQTLKDLKRNMEKGPAATWSMNHDILKWAQSIHKISAELNFLSCLRDIGREEMQKEIIQIHETKEKKVKNKKEK